MRKYILKLTKWLVLKYFSDGLSPIIAGDGTNEIIAWRWTFYDPKYENKKHKK